MTNFASTASGITTFRSGAGGRLSYRQPFGTAVRGLFTTIRDIVPIVAHITDRINRAPERETPDVGRRWGRPSSFVYDFDTDGSGDGHTLDEGPPDIKVRAQEVYREWERVKIVANDGSSFAEFERTKLAIFYYGLTKETREGSSPSGFKRDETTYTFNYIALSYNLNEGGEVVESGKRGVHPDETLAKVQSNFDNTVRGGIQKTREFWEGSG